jgi:signal transduction histidine kinase
MGRGLGLAAAAGIVRAHQGGMTVHSVPGQGSSFQVFLPAAGAAVSEGLPVQDTVGIPVAG